MNLEWLGIRLRFRWHSPPPFLAIPPARIIKWRTSAARLPRHARVHARTYSRVCNPTYPTGKVNRAFVTRMKERSLLWDRVSSLCASRATEFHYNLRLGIGKYISNTSYRFSRYFMLFSLKAINSCFFYHFYFISFSILCYEIINFAKFYFKSFKDCELRYLLDVKKINERSLSVGFVDSM